MSGWRAGGDRRLHSADHWGCHGNKKVCLPLFCMLVVSLPLSPSVERYSSSRRRSTTDVSYCAVSERSAAVGAAGCCVTNSKWDRLSGLMLWSSEFKSMIALTSFIMCCVLCPPPVPTSRRDTGLPRRPTRAFCRLRIFLHR